MAMLLVLGWLRVWIYPAVDSWHSVPLSPQRSLLGPYSPPVTFVVRVARTCDGCVCTKPLQTLLWKYIHDGQVTHKWLIEELENSWIFLCVCWRGGCGIQPVGRQG